MVKYPNGQTAFFTNGNLTGMEFVGAGVGLRAAIIGHDEFARAVGSNIGTALSGVAGIKAVGAGGVVSRVIR